MLKRSGTIRSLQNVFWGAAKIAAAIVDASVGNVNVVDNSHNGDGETPARAAGRSHTPSPPEVLPRSVVTQLHESKDDLRKNAVYMSVPSTRITRAAGFASLFVQLGWDHLVERNGEGILSSQSHKRVVNTLRRMRGVVLKLGQMLSIQDPATVPQYVLQLFEQVRDSAYAMSREQLDQTLAKEYGNINWRKDFFVEFDDEPIGAASIGQVHRATIKGEGDTKIEHVAVKVQYPGVAASIDSDIANLKMLISLHLLPPGMFVDRILQDLRQEFLLECRYKIEAAKQVRYAALIKQEPELQEVFVVPKVYEFLSTENVLVTQFATGIPVDRLANISGVQDLKNYVAERMLLLTLTELFRWHFMQTDPNYANFLFDAEKNKISLIDFGAAREYSEEFVKDYMDVVAAAARQDREKIIEKSIKLGFLTGNEMKPLLDAHAASVELLGRPFRHHDKPFDFSAENLPSKIQEHVPTIIKLRLRPPPTPVYSLHRRISGIILLATKLKATVNSGEMFWNIYNSCRAKYE
ncbi:putative ABC1 protein [Trypanosoma cruzi]|nr:putative ABC1 protein [Trypanosoma cruzi]